MCIKTKPQLYWICFMLYINSNLHDLRIIFFKFRHFSLCISSSRFYLFYYVVHIFFIQKHVTWWFKCDLILSVTNNLIYVLKPKELFIHLGILQSSFRGKNITNKIKKNLNIKFIKSGMELDSCLENAYISVTHYIYWSSSAQIWE